MKTQLLLTLSAGILLFACRKELPQLPVGENPVFFVEASGSLLNLNMEAGLDGVSFSDQETTLNEVKFYSGFLQKEDTSFALHFYPGEVFKKLDFQTFQGINTLFPVTQAEEGVAQFSLSSLSNSIYDQATFSINENSGLTQEVLFGTPGIYRVGINANRNGFNYNVENKAVIAYENPYVFELRGNINSSGPGIILEGEILNFSQNIQKIEWTCGSNSQTTTGTTVQFPTANSANELVAKVFFTDGVSRTRTIGLGVQNAPRIEDVVFPLEISSMLNFTNKFEVVVHVNGLNYSSRFATEFDSGPPYLSIISKTLYSDPVTQEKAYLIRAQGLVYVKNTSLNQTLTVPINLQMGLPLNF